MACRVAARERVPEIGSAVSVARPTVTPMPTRAPTARPTARDQPGTDVRAPRADLRVAAAMAVTVLLWASAFVVIRWLGPSVSPGALTVGRLLVASLALGVLVAVRRGRRPTRADWPRLLTLGVLWFAVYNLALNAGETRVDSGTAAMLVNVAPLVVAVLAGTVLGEGFPRALVVGSAVAFTGVVLIGTASSTAARADVVGVLLCLVAAVAYGVSVVVQKPLLGRLGGLEVTWVACTIGAVVCLPFVPRLVTDLRAADVPTALGVVYLGLLPTAVAFVTWAYVLTRWSAGRTGATTYLVPPLAVLLGWLLLDESPPALALVGGALCLAGVAVTRVRRRHGRGRARPT